MTMTKNTPSSTAGRDSDSEDSLRWHALVDGQLPPDEAAALRSQLTEDATKADILAHWQWQREQLKALHRDLLHAPAPDALNAAALRLADSRAAQAQWWRWGGMAASVLLAFVLGWTGRAQWQAPAGSTIAMMPNSASQPVAVAHRFVQQAAIAHAVYQPEVRHPVEVTAAQQDHLVQWLSKRLDRALKVPSLGPLGYELVGGRLLPGDTGARAQFMYQNGAGQRVTLYLGGLVPTTTPAASKSSTSAAKAPQPMAADTGFQFSQEGSVAGFYWTDGGFGYALSGQMPRAELLELATAVYQQLQP